MVVGNGVKIRFWADTWFGTSPLADQYPIYVICSEQNATISNVWDGLQLKFTFRQNFSAKLMSLWYELTAIASWISLSEEMDSLVWQFENKGVYSSSSLYRVINFRGMQPVFIPSLWQLKSPPRVHVFLWLLSHNKLVTKDNLRKRNIMKPECLFCAGHESIQHLMFDCIVAQNTWLAVSDFL